MSLYVENYKRLKDKLMDDSKKLGHFLIRKNFNDFYDWLNRSTFNRVGKVLYILGARGEQKNVLKNNSDKKMF